MNEFNPLWGNGGLTMCLDIACIGQNNFSKPWTQNDPTSLLYKLTNVIRLGRGKHGKTIAMVLE